MANPFTSKVSAMLFDDPTDLLQREQEMKKKLQSAARVGSPGKITTLLGYSGNTEE